jgi:pimeloyl-ACP methyl ester carboxylesterase
MTQQAEVTTGRVSTEGDEIYFEVRGRGPAVLMISGGLGDAGIYSFVANRLADEFRVITYDRRGQSRSTRRDPQNFSVGQQSRDGVAVLRAAGEESAIVFGSSSGAIIALEMGRSQPQVVEALIAHEPPTLRVLPDADRWLAFIAKIYLTALTVGHDQALTDFMASMALPPTVPDRELAGSTVFQEIQERQRANSSSEFGLREELLPCCHYKPDVEALRRNGVKVVLAIGKMTQDAGAYYGRTVTILAGQLGCETVVFPGHHGSHMVNPGGWAEALRKVLHRV